MVSAAMASTIGIALMRWSAENFSFHGPVQEEEPSDYSLRKPMDVATHTLEQHKDRVFLHLIPRIPYRRSLRSSVLDLCRS